MMNSSDRFSGGGSNFVGLKKQMPHSVNPLLKLAGSRDAKGNVVSVDKSSSILSHQLHINETVEEKRFRLFKWSYYEKVMLPLEYIKEKLLQNTNTIRFLSLFSHFTKVMLVWGDNSSLNQGLHI